MTISVIYCLQFYYVGLLPLQKRYTLCLFEIMVYRSMYFEKLHVLQTFLFITVLSVGAGAIAGLIVCIVLLLLLLVVAIIIIICLRRQVAETAEGWRVITLSKK